MKSMKSYLTCKTKKFVMAILHGKLGLSCDNLFSPATGQFENIVIKREITVKPALATV